MSRSGLPSWYRAGTALCSWQRHTPHAAKVHEHHSLQAPIQGLMLWHVQVARQLKAGWQSTFCEVT